MAFDFSLVSAPFRMQPGLRRIAAGAPQLTANAPPGGRHLREKMAVLDGFAMQALLSVPGFDARPILRAIAREAALSAPLAFAFDDSGSQPERCSAPLLGWSIRDGVVVGEGEPAIGALLQRFAPRERPAALLCLAFEEDFALLDGANATVPWLAVCLPSRWAPEEKIGRHFTEIHAPVADNAVLVAASASLARLVTGDERWERFVWTISPDSRLHQHPARRATAWPTGAGANELAALASFRSERQTFIPIARSSQAVFTIHVDSLPLVDAVTTSDAASRLHAALASMSPSVLAYKGLAGARDRLLAWLSSRHGQLASTPP
jgi:hypothetical protein